jgi:tetratricopeptide (TPR) repeat protein
MLFASDWHADTSDLSKADPPHARELFARWVADLLELGECSAALKQANSGTAMFPRYATGWYMRARAECATRDYEAARLSTERCLALEPTFHSAWTLLEVVLAQLGRPAAARAARQRSEEIGATVASRLSASVSRESTNRELTPAPDHGGQNTLVLVKPSRSFETPTLAEVYRRQGLLDRALGVYRRILERHPEDAGARAMVQKLEQELATRRRAVLPV